ncbi:hypothetical protein NDU88_008387 [Pleurodeles waltl]|uniref:Uncharacterized protein n=1 Tax=Pleurodeles waltl TaxID=8319 RepID=A0AAV7RXU6_PLEWA|nr:hypothetical protein NDU88_008387 [Pleurodeles waltl]
MERRRVKSQLTTDPAAVRDSLGVADLHEILKLTMPSATSVRITMELEEPQTMKRNKEEGLDTGVHKLQQSYCVTLGVAAIQGRAHF